MSQICNNCGQPMPDGVKYCPHCGSPTPLAPITDDEANHSAKTQAAGTTPPPVPPVPPRQQPPIPAAKPEPHSATPQRSGKRFGLAAAIAGASVAIILLLCALWYVRSNTHVTVVKRVSTQSIPVDSLGQADVDSIFQVMMQQSDKQMAMMDSMEREFLYGADAVPQEAEEDGGSESASRQTQPGVLNMGGRIGAQECVLHLNINDPQNVKGSARFVTKGRQGVPMKLIGIMNGDGSLTVSIYKGEEIAGTMIGSCNGQTFEGSFTTSGNKQIPFSFARMR